MQVESIMFASLLMLAQATFAQESRTPAVKQRAQCFTIGLNGSVADVTPLFGPVREIEWEPDWSPRFIHPPQGAQKDGVVFTTADRQGEDRLWVLTTYDVGSGRVEYVVFRPGLTASEIKINIVRDGQQHCNATITYRRSALTPEGNAEVAKLDSHWADEQRVHWQKAINDALAKGGRHD